jgi:hypothetical protein
MIVYDEIGLSMLISLNSQSQLSSQLVNSQLTSLDLFLFGIFV